MEKKVLIMLSNNSVNDPFLYSQLLDIYENDEIFNEKIIFCGDTNLKILRNSIIRDNGNGRNILVRYLIFYINLIKVLYSNRSNNVIIHIRGFISGILFFLIPKIGFTNLKYIYDPRGAVVYGMLEKSRKIQKFKKPLRYIDKELIRNSIFTIVESIKLKKQKIDLYGNKEKYLVCYNSSSFMSSKSTINISKVDSINICYCGSVNLWHDLTEIHRVFMHLSKVLKKKQVSFFFFTQKRNHNLVSQKFSRELSENKIKIAFIPYNLLEKEINKMHICISVVKPTRSTVVTSPIKISDYILKNKIFIQNRGIGDFDEFFENNKSAILYDFGEVLNFGLSDLEDVNCLKNKEIESNLLIETNRKKINNNILKFINE
ncbi:hypothetical protein MWU65_13175 [Cellulophaga sp. F20128]|uniref:hypothetical protein n=1 Tax=Cellulophaga sp. F20128 TaxID=2926413 RepID=UPI001FF3D285|nr:hypothetical protein [Cellulophaga sp. F20128]MCK0158139.1 hypothetical protein [Cellulophaga sp. F20128]